MSGDNHILVDFNIIHAPFSKMILKCLFHYNVYSNNCTIVRYKSVCNHTASLLYFSIETCKRRAVKYYVFVSHYCAVVGIHIVKS